MKCEISNLKQKVSPTTFIGIRVVKGYIFNNTHFILCFKIIIKIMHWKKALPFALF